MPFWGNVLLSMSTAQIIIVTNHHFITPPPSAVPAFHQRLPPLLIVSSLTPIRVRVGTKYFCPVDIVR